MPYCATNKFASTKRKLPRDLVMSSKVQASAEVAMAKRIRFDCSFPAILVAFTALGLGGCTSGKSLTLSSLQVTPANASVAEGSQQQFTATGTFSDGSTQDLTKSVRWSSSDNSIVTIDSAGLATTHSLGRPQITASGDTGVGTAAMVIGSTHLIIVAAAGTFLYVAISGSANISAYAIGRSTGALTTVPGSPFVAGSSPNSVAIDPAGRFAFVSNSSGNAPVFSIDVSTGALQPIPGSPFPAGTFGGIATLHPTAHFLYAINHPTNTLTGLPLDPPTRSPG